MSTDKLLTVLRQANLVVADLGINRAMECDRVRLEAELAIMRAKRVEIEVPVMCGRCNRKVEFCICGLWDSAPMTAEQHNKFPLGRFHESEFK